METRESIPDSRGSPVRDRLDSFQKVEVGNPGTQEVRVESGCRKYGLDMSEGGVTSKVIVDTALVS